MKQPTYKTIHYYPSNSYYNDRLSLKDTWYNYSTKNNQPGIPIANQPSVYELKFKSSSHHYVVTVVEVLSSIYPDLIGMTVYIDSAIFDKALLEGKVESGNGCTVLRGTYVFKNKGQLKLCEP